MPKLDLPTLIVGALLLLVVGGGVYVTYFRQTAELQRLEKAEKVAKMKRAEMQDLVEEYTQSQAKAREAMSKWRSRYKVVPDSLTSPEVVGYLNDLTRSGFETFDISVQGVERRDSYNHYRLRATGRGYFSKLYQFIWQIENNRQFYAVEDLTLSHIDLVTEVNGKRDGGEDEPSKRKRLQVMVSFNMSVNAYFGGPKGVTASSGGDWHPVGKDGTPKARSASLPPVPSKVLADADPDINPFFPVIMDQVPPNSRGLLDMDKADLVSIVGGKAVFKGTGGELHKVGEGDDVYLGQITDVNAARGRVHAVLNRGGIIDDVEATLGVENAYQGVTGTSPLAVPERGNAQSGNNGPERVGGGTQRHKSRASGMSRNTQVHPSGQQQQQRSRRNGNGDGQ